MEMPCPTSDGPDGTDGEHESKVNHPASGEAGASCACLAAGHLVVMRTGEIEAISSRCAVPVGKH